MSTFMEKFDEVKDEAEKLIDHFVHVNPETGEEEGVAQPLGEPPADPEAARLAALREQEVAAISGSPRPTGAAPVTVAETVPDAVEVPAEEAPAEPPPTDPTLPTDTPSSEPAPGPETPAEPESPFIPNPSIGEDVAPTVPTESTGTEAPPAE
jgi:hypothetical protein